MKAELTTIEIEPKSRRLLTYEWDAKRGKTKSMKGLLELLPVLTDRSAKLAMKSIVKTRVDV